MSLPLCHSLSLKHTHCLRERMVEKENVCNEGLLFCCYSLLHACTCIIRTLWNKWLYTYGLEIRIYTQEFTYFKHKNMLLKVALIEI